jgi:3-dehydroquinate synthase
MTATMSAGRSLTVSSALGDYTVMVEPTLLTSAATARSYLDELGRDHVVVADTRLLELYPDSPWFADDSRLILFTATETAKTLEGVQELYQAFVDRQVRRSTTVVIVGGGIVQDAAGFACHTFLRGVTWWYLPTTLLAQADSCIGAKTSLNHFTSKNILGAFARPARVLIDPEVLGTLSRLDRASGCGELLKVFVMKGTEDFVPYARDVEALLDARSAASARHIAAGLAVKTSYIEDDEFDRGRRQLLNYGHEFGHALEAATDFAVPHGLAVAIGIDFANRLSHRRGGAREEFVAEVGEVVRALVDGLPVPELRWADLLHHLARDKKRVGKELTVVVAHAFGDLEKLTDVTREEAEAVAAGLEHIRFTDLGGGRQALERESS